jgi:hypothetical protein
VKAALEIPTTKTEQASVVANVAIDEREPGEL